MKEIVALSAAATYQKVYPSEATRLAAEGLDKVLQKVALGESPDHLTASALVVHLPTRRLLMHWREQLRAWVQPGGHVESCDADLWSAARRELSEETGAVSTMAVVLEPNSQCPFDLDIHSILDDHSHGPHRHVDFRYVFVAEHLTMNPHGPERARLEWLDFQALTGTAVPPNLHRAIGRLRAFGFI